MRRRILAWSLACSCLVTLSIWFPLSKPDAIAKKEDDKPVAYASGSVDFSRDILPILSSKCFACHGPDTGTRKDPLRLDLRAQATKPRKRSHETPIVPGDSAHSEVVRRIFSDDPDERMPPKKGGKELTDAEKNLLKRWIDEGSEYQPHWAFGKVARPKPPTVKDNAWVKNDIDAFILYRLEKEGLTPSPAADRATLIRRLSLDLRGLPPSLAEIDEFLSDNSAGAYEKLVDRMLASPHYGEKMAMLWLDLARFGDTSGYHMDSTRQMSAWRDWVIDAFNQNMPFDQFTIEQLAGDLLPNATDKQKIASGFNRNTRFNEEGGVDPEEYVIRYNIDRTNTLGQVWLGMTLGCAECHSHKYDPISHREYYQLFAYFTGINEPMASGPGIYDKPLAPILRVPTPEQTKELAEERRMLPIIEKALAKELARIKYTDPLEGQPIPAMPDRELIARSQLAWEVSAKGSVKLPTEIYAALELDAAKRSGVQKRVLHDYYLRKVNEAVSDVVGPLERELDERAKKIKEIEEKVPYTLISEELAKPRPAFVLIRGDFTRKGEKVERAVPAIFPPVPTAAPKNRLGLARWLVRPDHPLTARVAVNRLWAQMFGNGIVHTIADFGTQGDLPSHPELLDWLACEFMVPTSPTRERGDPATNPTLAQGAGWDVKRLLRTIALSATYRQSSAFTPTSVKLDPHNRLLSRMPRYRLSAEELRDNALSIAGLINPKVGGPSFMPYQPPDFYKNKNEEWPWSASTGDEQYRRGLYAFWRRTALHPMFAILDAPNREECTAVRPRTNTPLQALVTLNDPSFVEAARVFAEKVMTQGPKDIDGRLTYAFRRATGRLPSAADMNVLRHQYRQQHDRFHADTEAASKLVNTGQYPRDAALDVRDLAAWTVVTNMLLNLDEVLTRE